MFLPLISSVRIWNAEVSGGLSCDSQKRCILEHLVPQPSMPSQQIEAQHCFLAAPILSNQSDTHSEMPLKLSCMPGRARTSFDQGVFPGIPILMHFFRCPSVVRHCTACPMPWTSGRAVRATVPRQPSGRRCGAPPTRHVRRHDGEAPGGERSRVAR